MVKEMTPEEERTKAWLEARGYLTEYEPAFIPAGQQRPDFWAANSNGDPSELWVEVKLFDQDASSKAMTMAWKVQKAAVLPTAIHGHAHLAVNEASQEQSVQSALKLYKIFAPKYADEKGMLVFVQQGVGETALRRAEIVTNSETRRLWVRGPATGPMACPSSFCDDVPFSDVTFWNADGVESKARAFEVLHWSGDPQCALTAWIDPDGPEIDSIGAHSSGSSHWAERTVRLLEKANGQLRSAVAIRPAPAIVVLVPYFDYVDDLLIQAGCYGVLKAPINVQSGTSGDLYHGEDGAFRSTKNRHISAAIRLWKNGEATYFPNPHAHHKIDDGASLFKGLHRANVSLGPGP